MSKIKNKKMFELALATGGSHYPGVGGELLEKFGTMVIEECAVALSKMPDGGVDSTQFYKNAQLLKKHFGVE